MIPSVCDLPAPCCTSLYDIAAHLLAAVFDALKLCCTENCDELPAYVTLGNGDDGVSDALTVQFQTVTPSANTQPGGLGLYRATFTIILKESGWPTARSDGESIILPQPGEQAAAARYMYSRGEAIHRRLTAMQTTRTLVPTGVVCARATVGTMSPLNPQGGVAGWNVPVTADLPYN